jgi:hypothetical protein
LEIERVRMYAMKSDTVIHSPTYKSTKLKLTQTAKFIIPTAMPNGGSHLAKEGILRTAHAENISKNPVKTKRKTEKNECVDVATPRGNNAVTIKETASRTPEAMEAQMKKFVLLSFVFHENIPAKNKIRTELVKTPPIL